MELLNKPLHEYIKSGEYYIDSRSWYRYKYIHPFIQRSVIGLLSAIICVVLLGVLMNINKLYPLIVQIKYSIAADSASNKTAQIVRANHVKNNPLASIADIMLRNYVIKRENYNYNALKKQFIFIKNNSTRIVFRGFYDFMDIDNPTSPVLVYQKSKHRVSNVISTTHLSPSKIIVKFESIIRNNSGEKIESKLWQATIEYEIDKISSNSPNGKRFNFTVTDYQLELLESANK